MPSPIIFDPATASKTAREIRASDTAFGSGSVGSGAIAPAAVLSGQVGPGEIGTIHLASGVIGAGFSAQVLINDTTYVAAEAINPGQPLAISTDPAESGKVSVARAVSGKMPAFGIATASGALNTVVPVHHQGLFESAFAFSGQSIVKGVSVFVAPDGRLSSVPPTGSGVIQQKVGVGYGGSGESIYFDPSRETVDIQF